MKPLAIFLAACCVIGLSTQAAEAKKNRGFDQFNSANSFDQFNQCGNNQGTRRWRNNLGNWNQCGNQGWNNRRDCDNDWNRRRIWNSFRNQNCGNGNFGFNNNNGRCGNRGLHRGWGRGRGNSNRGCNSGGSLFNRLARNW